MENYEKYFSGYSVPKPIKETAIAIMRRFTIIGQCDAMYIANTIAYFNNLGDGESHFNGNTEIIDSASTAKDLQYAYGCNIEPDEIGELREIILSGKLDNRNALYGIERFIRARKQEKRVCDSWRIDYLNKLINKANETYQEVLAACM